MPAAPATKYAISGKLGQGGVGEVLLVEDRDLERSVAMKRLLPQPGGTVAEDTLTRFLREAQTTGQLEHPNIVPVHDVGLDSQGQLYFTLKYVRGLSLRQVIRGRERNERLEKNGPFFRDTYTPRKMLEILIGVCQGIAFAHSKRVIHRDLKPENIMLGKFGEVLVMDWGLAKTLSPVTRQEMDSAKTVLIGSPSAEASLTMEGAIAGTPAYMAPEQAEGRISELDERTDIYALGAMLYEILSGKAPYEGGDAMEVLRRVRKEPPPRLLVGAHGFKPIPRELKAICEKAMQRRPEDRYRSASAMLRDLEAYLDDRPVSACPDSALQRLGKWARRNRRQVGAAAISAAAVFALALGSWFTYREVNIRRLLNQAEQKVSAGKRAFEQSKGATGKVRSDDPYRAQMVASLQRGSDREYRAALNQGNNLLLEVLDIAPKNNRARQLLADNYMELWRLALAEKNPDLMQATRAEVLRYAPEPKSYLDELNGMGSVNIALNPPETEAYLYSYELLQATDKEGSALATRLIPVPYDVQKQQPDRAFLEAERERAKTGPAVIEPAHSIFRIEPIASVKVGVGRVQIPALAPGSYVLFLHAPGRVDIRLPFMLARHGKVEQNVELPKPEDVPPGFVYVAGGQTIVGGDTAGAPPPRAATLKPLLIFHDELTMREYAEFLQDVLHHGKPGQVRAYLPQDFGKPLAVLSPHGELMPPGGKPSERFSNSPVRGVSYNAALAYIAWRSQRDGLPYRLPKEWEWESVCRGTDGRKFSWGEFPGKGLAVVTQGYGDRGANISWKWEDYKDEAPWGIVHNMAGGAAEWTDSLYDPKAAAQDPVFGQRTIRGNAWALPPVGLECAFRTSGQPDYFHPTIGFRLALDWPLKRLSGAGASAAHAH
ncbi:MAG TPA: bifunctional serine/threonine-protein kinase/formylglycine-generating enzyme family protein [Terriglobales bacterium]|nr:bifunctional serine/threonine-protein kinase/formylglycine-generating enzyme family protein [Terriglobales bacterium]